MNYLAPEQLKAILAQPDTDSPGGRRDAVLLSVLYDTGARVQEVADLKVRDVRLDSPALVRLRGKGRKERVVPLMESTRQMLSQYLQEQRRSNAIDPGEEPLFHNRQRLALTRSGISYIVKRHVRQAERGGMAFPDGVSPHVLRHTKAMHMLQSGVPVVIIRDFLGHVDMRTTEVYARADTDMKRRALEKAEGMSPKAELPSWRANTDLLAWLRTL